jgi:hypothetical protein
MRYHKATAITECEAKFIINNLTSSQSERVVVEHVGQFFDVRHMTEKEVDDFVDDLDRALNANVEAGFIDPH